MNNSVWDRRITLRTSLARKTEPYPILRATPFSIRNGWPPAMPMAVALSFASEETGQIETALMERYADADREHAPSAYKEQIWFSPRYAQAP